MALRKLYIFVEGNDDAMFFKGVIVPFFKKKYDDVEIVQYAQMKKARVDLFLTSIKTLRFDYFITADIDLAPSVAEKKRTIKHRFDCADMDNIIIVVAEIESWFLAGLSEEALEKFNLPFLDRTDFVTKEEFNDYYLHRFKSRIDFMQEILKNYSVEAAMKRNASFSYFFDYFFGTN